MPLVTLCYCSGALRFGFVHSSGKGMASSESDLGASEKVAGEGGEGFENSGWEQDASHGTGEGVAREGE